MNSLLILMAAILCCTVSRGQNCGSEVIGDPISRLGFAGQAGRLQVKNEHLISSNGQRVQLVGFSTQPLADVSPCYTKEAFRFLGEKYGVNFVRVVVPVLQASQQPLVSQSVLEQLGNITDWCEDLGLYVAVTLQYEGNPNDLLDREGASSGPAITFWETIASQFKAKAHVLYEIGAGPQAVGWNQLLQYHNAVIAAIRKVDLQVVILASTTQDSRDPQLPAQQGTVADKRNVMYTVVLSAGSHGYLHSVIKKVVQNDRVPLFISGWSSSDVAQQATPNLAEATKLLQLFQDLGLSWANVEFSQRDRQSAMLNPNACSAANFADLTCSGKFAAQQAKLQGGFLGQITTKAPTTTVTTTTTAPTRSQTRSPTTSPIPRATSPTIKTNAPTGSGAASSPNGKEQSGEEQQASIGVFVGGSIAGVLAMASIIFVAQRTMRHRQEASRGAKSVDIESLRSVPSSEDTFVAPTIILHPAGNKKERKPKGNLEPNRDPNRESTASEPVFAFRKVVASWNSVRSSVRSFW